SHRPRSLPPFPTRRSSDLLSPKTGGASPPDSYKLGRGEAFRLLVLDVRGKRVVVFLESAGLSAEQFPSFLASAGRLLAGLDFPRSEEHTSELQSPDHLVCR